MPITNPQKSHGSLIRLKEGAAGPYILLHKNTFPSVLERVARSNIANYSIFLLDGILFGFYDYIGTDYEKDMAEVFHTDGSFHTGEGIDLRSELNENQLYGSANMLCGSDGIFLEMFNY